VKGIVSVSVKILLIVLSLYFLDVAVAAVIGQFKIYGLSQFVLVGIGLLFIAFYLKRLPAPSIKTITLICFLVYLFLGDICSSNSF